MRTKLYAVKHPKHHDCMITPDEEKAREMGAKGHDVFMFDAEQVADHREQEEPDGERGTGLA